MVDAFLSNFYIWKKIVFNQNATLWKQTGFLLIWILLRTAPEF